MKNKIEKIGKGNQITRKEALRKIGFAALTATTFVTLLNSPRTAAASSASPEAPPPPGGGGAWD